MAKSSAFKSGQASTELRKHNEELLDELEDGDLIEFPRGVYSHWAVYVGDGYVVHLAGDENDGINAQMNPAVIGSLSGKRNNKATVRKDDFWDVVGDSRAEKNNSKDRRYKPRPKKEIVRNALESVGKVGYNLLEENCEHFATWCRYELAVSDQANAIKMLLGALGLGLRRNPIVEFLGQAVFQ